MFYIDANVFLYPVLYEESDRNAANARRILLKIASGEIDAATSVLSWDEFVWVVRKCIDTETSQKEGRKFLSFPNLHFLRIDEYTLEEAQRITEKYGLKPRDAVHIACALKNNIKEIISNDSDFDKVKEIKRTKI